MTSRFAARPLTGRPKVRRRIIGRSAADYANAYHEQQEEMDDGAEDQDTPVFPMWKSVAIAVIVIACFASIYPKLLHPLLMAVMGHSDRQSKTQVDSDLFPHSSMRHPGGAGASVHPHYGSGPTPGHDRFPSAGARVGPMPGMGGHAPQFGTESSNRSGSWHWLLPFYTIGIVFILIYSLGKLLWKRPKLNARHRYNLRYNSGKDRFEANYPGMDSEAETEEEDDDEASISYGEDGEDLGVYGQERGPHGLGGKQLHNLQSRLQETESAMQNILAQLEHLSANADPAEVERVKKNAAATLSNLNKNGPKSYNDESPEPVAMQTYQCATGEKKSRSAERKLPEFLDTGEPAYISDLEKALSDFQKLSDDYVKQHSKSGSKEKEKSKIAQETSRKWTNEAEVEARPSDNNAAAARVFDIMESDQAGTDALTVSPGVGELVPVGSHSANHHHDNNGGATELSNGVHVSQKVKDFSAEDDDNCKIEAKKMNVRKRKGRKARKASEGLDE